MNTFLKWAIPCHFFIYFCSAQTIHTILTVDFGVEGEALDNYQP